jgi:UDP-2,3-diacylglucosamine hydrolase
MEPYFMSANPRTLFISDLHLDPAKPDIQQAFLEFLSHQATHCQALYILGDFFEVWLGDDNVNAFNATIIDALKDLTVPIFLMHGNRDFLLGEQFCASIGATLLDDPIVIDLHGTPTLLMHGDSLCTGDSQYMQVRTMLRSSAFQADFLSKTLAERAAFADNARQQSQAHTQQHTQAAAVEGNSTDIMDVTESEVVRMMAESGVQQMIHGHTHRPARHELTVDDKPAERIVLGDWDKQGWFITANADGVRLESFDIH